MRVTGLFIYPVKSLRAVQVSSFEVTTRGPRHDRGFMVVDPTGKFMSQRETPKMTLLQPTVLTDSLHVQGPVGELLVPLSEDHGRRDISVWKDRFSAIDCGDEAAKWFSAALEKECRLVRMADDAHRGLDPKYVSDASAETGFSDGYPLLIANEASLEELNSRLEVPVPMNRFRPNVVVSGPAAWAEDGWSRVQVGALELDAVKPCSRCPIITTDQLTGERAGKEPLKTLASYRTMPKLGAIFGMNLVPRRSGITVHVGDSLEVAV